MRMGRNFVASAITVAIASIVMAPAAGMPGSPADLSVSLSETTSAPYVHGEVLVRYEPRARASARAAARAAVGAVGVRSVPDLDMEVVRLPEHARVPEAAAVLRRRTGVEAAQPNYLYGLTSTTMPNDTLFVKQWSLHNTGQAHYTSGGKAGADIDAPEAWSVTTGSADVVVAIVDTGVKLDHPDLVDNLVAGWDFVDGDAVPDDPHGHGTHVAGIVGARGNNGTGVTGVAWRVSLMPVRVLNSFGSGTTLDIAKGFTYAAKNGAHVVNASLGALIPHDAAIHKAIKDAPNTLFVVAAGNQGNNIEDIPTYPCVDPSPNLICVAATDDNDALADFSNHGTTSVDLAAPGVHIASTYIHKSWCVSPCYVYMSGTSMATPVTSGAAALLWSAEPDATVAQVRDAILASGDERSSLSGKTVTGRRLNVASALTALLDVPLFTDVDPSMFYYPHVQTMARAGITSGCSTEPRRYCPKSETRRDQMAVFLIRAGEQAGAVAAATGLFSDVSLSSSMAPFIEELYAQGVTSGCGTDPLRYCPGDLVTRAQMAVFIIRALGEDVNLAPYRGLFSDVPATSLGARHIERMADLGITSGCGGGKFCPKRSLTRGEMAVFIVKAFDVEA